MKLYAIIHTIAFGFMVSAYSPPLYPTVDQFGGVNSSLTNPSNTSQSVMATPDTFNPHFGALNSPSRRLGNHLPPETRLAWLEYLANVYIQCDDFPHARELIDEMYYWLVEHPRLRRNISVSVQILQRRIDRRHDCLLQAYGPDSCHLEHRNHKPKHNLYSHRHYKGDITATAAANLAKVMDRIHFAAILALTDQERKRLRVVFKLLKNGYVTAAMAEFQRTMSEFPNCIEKEAVRKFEFVLKLVKFDLENPDNCLPLWRTTCCMNWKIKWRILDTYELLKRHVSGHHRSVSDILRRIEDIPMFPEIYARLLVATGKIGAWSHLGSLPIQDRYVAKACLALKGLQRPNFSAFPELFGEPKHHIQSVSYVDELDARAKAKEIYRQCIYDKRLSRSMTRRCQEGLSEVQGLEKSCPYGGFVRIGLFSQIFGDYLFIKCLSPPTSLPINYFRNMIPLNIMPNPSPIIESSAPLLSNKHYRMIERLEHMMKDFQNNLHDLEPMRANMYKLHKYDPNGAQTTEKLVSLHHNIDKKLDQWICRLRRYLGHLRDFDHNYHQAHKSDHRYWRYSRTKPSPREAVEQISNYLADLANDLQRSRNSNFNY